MPQSTSKLVDKLTRDARRAGRELNRVSPAKITRALNEMAKLLRQEKTALQTVNKRDLEAGRKRGLSPAMLDRLTLADKTIAAMIDGICVVAALQSPVGKTFDRRTRPNGLNIYKVRAPIGVIGIIYESRPNVTVDAAAICLKSHNAVILRGGSEAIHSNKALAALFQKALSKTGLPRAAVQLVPSTERQAINELLTRNSEVDLIIPRGGEGLINTVVHKSTIPVIKHYKGVCHVYISRKADMSIAVPIAVNAKVQRPGVCNAMETLLIDSRLSKSKKRRIIQALLDNGAQLCGNTAIRSLDKRIKAARRADWEAEYLDLRLAVREVSGVDEAIEHINTYGSHHTESIVSTSAREIQAFMSMTDSSSLIVNASTRFSDGGEYGMGCEIGISTDKLHARGPMGVEDLTTYKWIVEGAGQIRE
ncbi:MAG: glutamate-5-semialdehyde dehydrogenase [Chitinivibrionales bacterium]|nr:glutamate-5-semialdehyde dehydrogenase [Chitinivibrionales bacterium]